MTAVKNIVLVLVGFGAGAVISAGVFAFITVLGVIPRLAQKSHTEHSVKFYEEVILFGGLFGCLAGFFDFKIKLFSVITVIISFLNGIFVGCLAVSLAETIDVIPIMTRRAHIQEGLMYFVIALALGKLLGALLYFVVPGFYTAQ